MDGYERYSANKALSDNQILEIVDLLNRKHRKFLKFFSFGGHNVSERALLKVTSILAEMPSVSDLILPIDGLSDEVKLWYSNKVKLTYAAGDVPRDDPDPTQPRSLGDLCSEVKKAVLVVENRRGRPVAIRYVRDGLRILL